MNCKQLKDDSRTPKPKPIPECSDNAKFATYEPQEEAKEEWKPLEVYDKFIAIGTDYKELDPVKHRWLLSLLRQSMHETQMKILKEIWEEEHAKEEWQVGPFKNQTSINSCKVFTIGCTGINPTTLNQKKV